MQIKRCTLLLLSLLLVLAPRGGMAAESALAAKPTKTVRLLTVGNSFSQNATRFLGSLAAASGNVLVHHQAVIGGATLQQHWEKAEQYEKNPRDTNGFYGSHRSLQQELRAEPWNFVTIQQASIRSHDVTTYHPCASNLCAYIKQYAPQAEVLLHQTWAYRCDDPRFAVKSPKPGEPTTQEEMYQGLTRAYQTIAAELGLRLIPVGDAFHLADTDPAWGYRPDRKFDFKRPQPPLLPDQTHSLHRGWQWQKKADGTVTLGLDGHHAGTAGEYLGACVWYEVLFEKSPVGNTFVPPGLSLAESRFLQETAHRAVLNDSSLTHRPRRGQPRNSESRVPVASFQLSGTDPFKTLAPNPLPNPPDIRRPKSLNKEVLGLRQLHHFTVAALYRLPSTGRTD